MNKKTLKKILDISIMKLTNYEHDASLDLLKIALDSVNSTDFFDPLFSLYAMSSISDKHQLLKKFDKYNLSGNRILDLGSGIGRHSYFLATKGYHVTSVEKSHFGYSFQKELSQITGVDWFIVRENAHTWKPELPMDAVLCLFTTLKDASIGSLVSFFLHARYISSNQGILIYETLLPNNVPEVFSPHESAQWQLGTIDKKESFDARESKLELEWTWHYEDGEIVKNYSCIIPRKENIIKAAQLAGWSVIEILDFKKDGLSGHKEASFAFRINNE